METKGSILGDMHAHSRMQVPKFRVGAHVELHTGQQLQVSACLGKHVHNPSAVAW